jgi:hypothetical protein
MRRDKTENKTARDGEDMKIIETYAQAKRIPAGYKRTEGNITAIINEGQSCIALIPGWENWGATLKDGTRLKEGKYYKITIEIPGKGEPYASAIGLPPSLKKFLREKI